jgi:hypothetical protein
MGCRKGKVLGNEDGTALEMDRREIEVGFYCVQLKF